MAVLTSQKPIMQVEPYYTALFSADPLGRAILYNAVLSLSFSEWYLTVPDYGI